MAFVIAHGCKMKNTFRLNNNTLFLNHKTECSVIVTRHKLI